jgi:distribution and morphology protein 31
MNRQRIRTVGLWSLQMTASAVLSTVRNVLNPGFAQLREAYVNGNLELGMSLGLGLGLYEPH